MRVITGLAKGHKLKVPKNIRPAKDFVRGAVFSILGEKVKRAKVLDLFAGSGAYGIEALSRGASFCDFVDKSRAGVKIIGENLKHTKLSEKGKIYPWEAEKFVKRTPTKYDLIFVDPPYSFGLPVGLLKRIKLILENRGVVVFEHSKKTKLPGEIDGLRVVDRRTFGATAISLLTQT